MELWDQCLLDGLRVETEPMDGGNQCLLDGFKIEAVATSLPRRIKCQLDGFEIETCVLLFKCQLDGFEIETVEDLLTQSSSCTLSLQL